MTSLAAAAIALLQVLPLPADLPPPLFVVQDLPDPSGTVISGTVKQRALVRVALDREHHGSLETIVTKDQQFFGSFPAQHLWGGSYVATRKGSVIDTLARQVIHDVQFGDLLGFEAGRGIYRVEAFQETSIYAFDLKTAQAEKLASPGHWELYGSKSPDKRKGATGRGMGVRLRQLAVTEPVPDQSAIDIHCPRDTSLNTEGAWCAWLDNEQVLTYEQNGQLFIADLHGNIAPWLMMPGAADDPLNRPRLMTDRLGRIIFRCGGIHYWIDPKAKAATRLQWHALGHDFETSAAEAAGTPRTVRHLGKEIGRWDCDPFAVQTAPGLIALAFHKAGEPGARRYLAIWSHKRGEWQTQNILVSHVIGWGR